MSKKNLGVCLTALAISQGLSADVCNEMFDTQNMGGRHFLSDRGINLQSLTEAGEQGKFFEHGAIVADELYALSRKYYEADDQVELIVGDNETRDLMPFGLKFLDELKVPKQAGVTATGTVSFKDVDADVDGDF